MAGATPGDYVADVQQDVRYDGRPSAFLESKPSATKSGFATIMQMFSAVNYLGKRVRFRAAVKTQDSQHAALWMRVDGSLGLLHFDNMQNRPITGTTDWRMYDVVLDVPDNAIDIAFGLLEVGIGKAWLNAVSFDIVNSSTPTTDMLGPAPLPTAPRNLIF